MTLISHEMSRRQGGRSRLPDTGQYKDLTRQSEHEQTSGWFESGGHWLGRRDEVT